MICLAEATLGTRALNSDLVVQRQIDVGKWRGSTGGRCDGVERESKAIWDRVTWRLGTRRQEEAIQGPLTLGLVHVLGFLTLGRRGSLCRIVGQEIVGREIIGRDHILFTIGT